jgi:hypothetical protein
MRGWLRRSRLSRRLPRLRAYEPAMKAWGLGQITLTMARNGFGEVSTHPPTCTGIDNAKLLERFGISPVTIIKIIIIVLPWPRMALARSVPKPRICVSIDTAYFWQALAVIIDIILPWPRMALARSVPIHPPVRIYTAELLERPNFFGSNSSKSSYHGQDWLWQGREVTPHLCKHECCFAFEKLWNSLSKPSFHGQGSCEGASPCCC